MLRIESFYNLLISLHFYIYFKIRKNCAGVHILYTPAPPGPGGDTRGGRGRISPSQVRVFP